jgi:hypothetical protein
MDFQGPEPADLAHVHSLNSAFLTVAARGDQRLLAQLPSDTARYLVSIEPLDRARLARSPFLLYSLNEHDDARWERMFDGQLTDDLLDTATKPHGEEAQLVSATLGFLWQFARRNAYAARVISGASLHWCERIADITLIELFRFAAVSGDLLSFRQADSVAFWRRLLCAGTSPEVGVRSAAKIAALQTVLTSSHWRQAQSSRAAACTMPIPRSRVAEQRNVSNSARHGYNTPPHESPDNKKPRKDLRQR